jgi:hypothetical protein
MLSKALVHEDAPSKARLAWYCKCERRGILSDGEVREAGRGVARKSVRGTALICRDPSKETAMRCIVPRARDVHDRTARRVIADTMAFGIVAR